MVGVSVERCDNGLFWSSRARDRLTMWSIAASQSARPNSPAADQRSQEPVSLLPRPEQSFRSKPAGVDPVVASTSDVDHPLAFDGDVDTTAVAAQ